MILRNSFYIAILFASLLLAGCGGEQGQQQPDAQEVQQPGDRVPSVDLSEHRATIENAEFTDLDGNPVDMSQFRGKLVLIDFWESWCGPCLQVFPAMQELREEYPDEFEMLAVTVGLTEGPEDARAFAEEHGYDFTWLYDANGVFNELGGSGIPFKVYVNPDGELIEIEMGSRGRQGDYNSAKSKITEYF